MKREAKKYMLLAITLFTILSHAAETPFYETKSGLVAFEKTAYRNQLFIRNSQGIILYKKVIEKSESYDTEFDLTELLDGNYTFELEKGLQIKITPFVIVLDKVVFFKEKQTVIHKPIIRVKENTITLSRLSLTSESLALEIYNSRNELISSENFEDLMIVSRGYKFSRNEKGNYKIVIKTDGRIFVEVVTI